MTQENEVVSKNVKSGVLEDGCESVTCPNPDCNQVFLDLDEDFWQRGNSDIECRKCKQPIEHVGCLSSRNRPSKSIYIYRCVTCNINFTRKIPAMKKRCPSCKEEFYMFWNLLLGLPGLSVKRPEKKMAMQSA